MVLTGRGLFYGATHGSMSEATWQGFCQQARTWGMAYVHPKVADRTGYWYNDAELVMLRDVARAHGLTCLPYYYVTPQGRDRQADMAAHIGSIFGGVVPDMEDEWFRDPNDAVAFGARLRSQFKGLVIPTLYADPSIISQFPYAAVLHWCDGWMPMAYFDVWQKAGRPMTAHDASQWLQPQWNKLNQELVAQHIQPPAILPLIATDIAKLPVSEVVSWLRAWHGILGYCGFWWDGTYGPYAEAVLHEPEPTWHLQSVPVTPAPAPAPKPTPAPIPEPVRTSTPPPAPVEQVPFLPANPLPANTFFPAQTAGLACHLSEQELLALWRAHDGKLVWDPSHAIIRVWIQAVQFHPELGIGSPLADEQHGESAGEPMQTIRFDSGHEIIYFQKSGRVVLFGGPVVMASVLEPAGASVILPASLPATPAPAAAAVPNVAPPPPPPPPAA